MLKSWQDSWLFHLKVASGSGIDDMGTEFEKHIFELISQDCDPGNTYLLFSNNFSIKRIIFYWKCLLLANFGRDDLSGDLTSYLLKTSMLDTLDSFVRA